MRIICLADTHGAHLDLDIPDGDVLVFAGDVTRDGTIGEVVYFNAWLECARTAKDWIHFNLDWEDKYVKLHDTLLNEKKPDLSRCII